MDCGGRLAWSGPLSEFIRNYCCACFKGIKCVNLSFQACRYGHVQHLEHLLFYGADMSAQNASGNTALHVCALYNQVNFTYVVMLRVWCHRVTVQFLYSFMVIASTENSEIGSLCVWKTKILDLKLKN